MTLYYTMRPDDVEAVDPVFTRYGGMTSYLEVAMAKANRCKGRVYATNGGGNVLIHDAWTPPVPVKPTKVPYREFVRIRTEAALFGLTVSHT